MRGAFVPENTPKYLFGKPYQITPVRKDLIGYKGLEGDDFMTYELFVNAVRQGKINPQFLELISPKRETLVRVADPRVGTRTLVDRDLGYISQFLTPETVKGLTRNHYGKIRNLFLLEAEDRPSDFVSDRSLVGTQQSSAKERRRTEAFYKERLESIRKGRVFSDDAPDYRDAPEYGFGGKKRGTFFGEAPLGRGGTIRDLDRDIRFTDLTKAEIKKIRDPTTKEGKDFVDELGKAVVPTASFYGEWKNNIARQKVAERIAEAKDRRKQRNPKGYGSRATDRKIGRILRNQKVEPMRLSRTPIDLVDIAVYDERDVSSKGKFHFPEVEKEKEKAIEDKVVRLGDELFLHRKHKEGMVEGANPKKGGKTYVLYKPDTLAFNKDDAAEVSPRRSVVSMKGKVPIQNKAVIRKTSDGRYIVVDAPRIKKKKVSRKVRVFRTRDLYNNPSFTMRVLGRSGGGRRVFHLDEEGNKGYKEVGVNQYRKQADAWKALDMDSTPYEKRQLRGLRDRRTHGARLIGRGYDPRRIDRSSEYKSARNEALIQMRINESAGVRDAKSKAQKEIKEIRISEAQKALNLRLAKETAEKTTEALKAKNAGITHSYNVNVRNQTAATLLGSNPDELNKLLRKGGGLALIKAMVRKGEIADISTIGQLNLGQKQKESLIRLHNEGGQFIEGQEYFFRTLDDFGQTGRPRRGFLNKGGERKDNLVLTYIQTLDDGSQKREQFIVPKENVLRPDDYTSTTASGKQQKPEPKQLTQFELDTLGSPKEGGTEIDLPDDISHFGAKIKQDPKTGVKSLVALKGSGIHDPSPKTQEGIFGGGGLPLELDAGESSDDPFDFSSPKEGEPEPQQLEELPTPYGKKPRPQELDLFEATEGLAEVAGVPTGTEEILEGIGQQLEEVDEEGELQFHENPASLDLSFTKEVVGQPDPADLLLAQQLQQEGKEGPLPGGLIRSPDLAPKIPTQSPRLSQFVPATPPEEQFFQKPQPEPEPEPAPKKEKKKKVKIGGKREVKILSIDERGDKLFEGDAPTNAQGRPFSNDPFKGHDYDEYYLPEEFYREGRDMSDRARRTASLEDIEKGQTAIWSTKHGDKKSQKLLVLDAPSATHLFRALKGQTRENDKGNQQGKGDKQLRDTYKKVLRNIADGKKETAINDKVLLRLFGVIDPA